MSTGHFRQPLSDDGRQDSQLQQDVAQLAEQLRSQQEVTDRLHAELTGVKAELNKMASIQAATDRVGSGLDADGATGATFELSQTLSSRQSSLVSQLEEEKRRVTEQMQEICRLSTELVKERTEHARTRKQLALATVGLKAAAGRTTIKQVAQLKAWVIDSGLEDDTFFQLMNSSKSRKPDWVKYVQQKLDGLEKELVLLLAVLPIKTNHELA